MILLAGMAERRLGKPSDRSTGPGRSRGSCEYHSCPASSDGGKNRVLSRNTPRTPVSADEQGCERWRMFAKPSAQQVDSRLIPLYDRASPSLPRGRSMSRNAVRLRARRPPAAAVTSTYLPRAHLPGNDAEVRT